MDAGMAEAEASCCGVNLAFAGFWGWVARERLRQRVLSWERTLGLGLLFFGCGVSIWRANSRRDGTRSCG
jgi:hypothetical protein